MRRTFQTAILLLAITLVATSALAGGNSFDMPKDMVKLLPVKADGVLGISSLNKLDKVWQDVLPEGSTEEEVSLMPIIKDALLGFEDMIDPDEPLLITTHILPSMDAQGILITAIFPLKDKNQDFSTIEGIENFQIVHQGDYVGVSTDPNWKPASEKPVWAKELRDGLVTGYIDLASIIDTYGFLIEMGVGAMQSQAQNGTDLAPAASVEETMATIKMIRAFLESANSMEFVLAEDGKSIQKDFIFSTKPDSPLAPGPQPSFDDALKLTRFLPGGESLLAVSAIDQSKQMEIYADYYLASIHSKMANMDTETGERYALWYAKYLNTMEISFLPNALAMRVEKDNSSFQYLLQSSYAKEDFERLTLLANGLNDIGSGVNLIRIDSEKVDDLEIFGWNVDWQKEELEGLFDTPSGVTPTEPLMTSTVMKMLRFVPGNLYMAQVKDYILICGGTNNDMMKQLARNAAKGKGNVDPRVKKALKNAGPGLQSVTTGDLNALMQIVTEVMEEMEEQQADNADPKPTFNWPINQPVPFLQSLEIDGAEYLMHFEMEKAVIRELIQALMEDK